MTARTVLVACGPWAGAATSWLVAQFPAPLTGRTQHDADGAVTRPKLLIMSLRDPAHAKAPYL
ncbi:hypothetical protein, partial [Streptomyces parvulus]|uniref:hypothetical protein n=1 Tax=Streptomyces parvulus TaxID=146923 RepID=UPI0033B80A96